MRSLVIAALLVCAVMAFNLPTEQEIKRDFQIFVSRNEHDFGSDMAAKYKAFRDNVLRASLYNYFYNTDVMSVNKFSHLTPEEFKKRYTMKPRTPAQMIASMGNVPEPETYDLTQAPASVDWRKLGGVTPVKNQASCGSCWAFSATGAMEGVNFIKNKKLVSLSEQNLVDCDHECSTWQNQTACDAGCNGGLMWNAFSYVMKNKGIDTESSYKYEASDGTCRFNKKTIGATVKSWKKLPTDEAQLAAALAVEGPIPVAINADLMQSYGGGILKVESASDCDPDALDHGVLLVGYGEEDGEKFWIVKNSWDTNWGEDGYMRITRGTNACGIASVPTTVVV